MEEIVFSLDSCKTLKSVCYEFSTCVETCKFSIFLVSRRLPFCESFKDAFALSYFHLAVTLTEWKLAEKTVPLCCCAHYI